MKWLKTAIKPAIIGFAVFMIFSSACAIPHILYIKDRPHPQVFEWWIAVLPEHGSILLSGIVFGMTACAWSWGSVISDSLAAVSLATSFFAFSLWMTSVDFVVIITRIREYSPTPFTERIDDILWSLAASTLLALAVRTRHNKGRHATASPPPAP